MPEVLFPLDSAKDILDAPLLTVHKLSGPFGVEGAKPGDLLVVDILDVGPIPQEDSGPLAGQGWGYTGIFSKNNGGSFLVEQFPDAYKAIWDFTGQVATSRHVPEVRFEGLIHPGLMGTAPSAQLLAKWNKREGDLIATDPHRVPPLALPPEAEHAVLGVWTSSRAAWIHTAYPSMRFSCPGGSIRSSASGWRFPEPPSRWMASSAILIRTCLTSGPACTLSTTSPSSGTPRSSLTCCWGQLL